MLVNIIFILHNRVGCIKIRCNTVYETNGYIATFTVHLGIIAM